MRIVDLEGQPADILEQAAQMLVDEFTEPRGWPTIEKAREEVGAVIRDGFACGAVENDLVLGWIGGLPEYHGRVWELHPLVVR